jgi:hypothetical protein
MRKLVTTLGSWMALMMLGLTPPGLARAENTVTIPVWDFAGTWSGKANIMTEDEGYLQDIEVTVVVPSGQNVDPDTGMVYFKASVTFGAPFGTGNPFDLLAAVKTKAPSRRKQDAMVMWSGNGVMGCSMGGTVFLDPNRNTGPDPMLLHGCMHFTSDALTKPPGQAAITDAPAMAIVDVEKQQ